MKTIFGRVVFAVGKTEYFWEDVVLAADIRGEWSGVCERTRQAIACLEDMNEDDSALSEEEVDSAADEFRYERDLVSAQEMEEWLDHWGLSVESWMEYIRSSLLRRKWSDRLSELVSDHPADDETMERYIKGEALCSGDLARFARELAGHAAVYEKLLKETGPDRFDPEKETGKDPETPPPARRNCGLPRLDAKSLREKTEMQARLPAALRHFRKQVLTPRAIEAWIRAQQADWTRVECSYVSFPEEEMAREAALAVREDGRPLAEVAADARTEFRRGRFLVEEFDPSVRGRFLSAQKGETVGPLELGEAFVLYQLLDKTPPSPGDEELNRRAEETLLKKLVGRESDDRVKWHERI